MITGIRIRYSPLLLLFPVLVFQVICSGQQKSKQQDRGTCEWHMSACDGTWQGYTPDPEVKPPFRLKWATQHGLFKSAATVADGKVYTPSGCLDAKTGEELWRADLGDGAPIYHRGKLYYRSGSSMVCYDPAARKIVWKKWDGCSRNRGYRNCSTAADGAIFFNRLKKKDGKDYYHIDALNCENGDIIWSAPLVEVPEKPHPQAIYALWRTRASMAPPGVGFGRVLVTTHNPKMIFALDQKTGKELWRVEGILCEHAVGTDGTYVWAAESGQGLWAMDAETGKKLWHWGGNEWEHKGYRYQKKKPNYNIRGTARYSPTVLGGFLVTSNYGRNYTILDRKTGKHYWTVGDMWGRGIPATGGCGPPTAAGKHIYSCGLIGKAYNGSLFRYTLSATHPEEKKVVWKHPLVAQSCGRVAVANGCLFPASKLEISCFEPVPPDYRNEPQPPPEEPAEELKPLAAEYKGEPGTPEAGGRPEGGKSWPMYGGCPARCGLELNIALPVKYAWKFTTGRKIRSDPVIADTTVYVGGDCGKLFALELDTGKEKWSAKIVPHPESKDQVNWIRSAPAVCDGTVVCGADDGVMRAFDAKTGKPKWQFRTAGRIRSSPAITGDRVVFGSWDGNCYCVNLADGKEFWRRRAGLEAGVRVHAPVAVANGTVYVEACEDHTVHALDLGTGKPRPGFKPYRHCRVEGISVYRGLLAVYFAQKGVAMLEAETGIKRASSQYMTGIVGGPPVFSKDLMFDPVCLRGADINTKGSISSKGRGRGHPRLNSPLVAGGLMITATSKGTLGVYRALDAQSKEPLKPLWEWKSESSARIHTAPAAADGFIVIGSDDGNVYAFSYVHP